MQAGNAAICCRAGVNGGIGAGGGNNGVGLPGLSTVTPAKSEGFVSKIEQALQAAVHGSGSVSGGSIGDTLGGAASGAEAVPFPMVNPYGPLRRAGRVSGINAFPAPRINVQPARNARIFGVREISLPGVRRSVFNMRGDEPIGAPAQSASVSGFEDLAAQVPEGVGLDAGFSGLGSLGAWGGGGGILESVSSYSSGPTKLQTVLGTIQATLPATIAALRANPNNLYSSQSFNPYAPGQYTATAGGGGAGADIGGQAGAAVGNIGDTVSNIVAQHPYLVLAGGAALVLLFMSPPRRR